MDRFDPEVTLKELSPNQMMMRMSVTVASDNACVCAVCFRYCAGTTPWGNPSEHHDYEPQRHDDGYIEVIGFTMTSLVWSSPTDLVAREGKRP